MDKTEKISKTDARIISLYSQGSKIDTSAKKLGIYSSSLYYRAIEVTSIKTDESGSKGETSPLLFAYKTAVDSEKSFADQQFPTGAFLQTILAFADVTEAPGIGQYTQDEIDVFWDDRAPILFTTFLNISSADSMAMAVERINNLFERDKCKVYFAFDSYDIIIFYKGQSIADYVRRIHQLCYQKGEQKESAFVVDCMTMFGFNMNSDTVYDSNEQFDVLLQFGADNMSEVRNYIKNKSPKMDNVLVLGRRDVYLYYEDVNLPWVKRTLEELTELEGLPDHDKNILNNINLQLLVNLRHAGEGVTASSYRNKKEVTENTKGLLGLFEQKYEEMCKKELLIEDKVFLRWLKDSLSLALEFYSNALSSEVAICLLPQYISFMKYYIRFFESILRNKKRQDKLKTAGINWMDRGKILFFNTVLMLLESSNHSDRQFIQAPSFHSISFEMPPKLLAFFSICAHYLIDAFQDKDENEDYHGYMISPSFASELDVSTLAPLRNDHKDNLLSIGIGESSMYTLKHTMEVLAHEVSHFVGEDGRCRPDRKRYILQYAIWHILSALVDRLVQYPPLDDHDVRLALWKEQFGRLIESITTGKVDKILYELKKANPYYDDKYIYMHDIEQTLLPELVDAIALNFDVNNIIINWLMEGVLHNVSSGDEPRYSYETKWKEKLDAILGDSCNIEIRRGVLQEELERWLGRQTYHLKDYYYEKVIVVHRKSVNRSEMFCYLFREAYADLQTILLFSFSWADYVNLIVYQAQNFAPNDRPRLLAVAKTMRENSVDGLQWMDNEFRSDVYSEMLRDIHPLIMTDELSDPFSFIKQDINPVHIYYLRQYLSACRKEISKHLKNRGEKKDDLSIQQLHELHNMVSQNGSVLALETRIKRMTEQFEQSFENELKNWSSLYK